MSHFWGKTLPSLPFLLHSVTKSLILPLKWCHRFIYPPSHFHVICTILDHIVCRMKAFKRWNDVSWFSQNSIFQHESFWHISNMKVSYIKYVIVRYFTCLCFVIMCRLTLLPINGQRGHLFWTGPLGPLMYCADRGDILWHFRTCRGRSFTRQPHSLHFLSGRV